MFDYLLNKYKWKAINGCPGRYIMAEGVISLTPHELVGKDFNLSEKNFASAKDKVLYVYFEDGGLISYEKNNGYLHTLCTIEGMARKMALFEEKKLK
jgi:hypothetical protein